MTDPYVIQPGRGRSFSMGPDPAHVLVEAETTGGQFAMLEANISPGIPGPPLHVHTDGLDEIWYVLEGELDFIVGDTTTRGGPGATAFVPAGTVHTFANPTDAPARWIGIFRPASGMQMLEELSAAFPADGMPDLDLMMRIFGKYGVEVVDPPA